ncbi:hypothetical protein BK659_09310 [Pseudomonas brassicacearum]|uniref:Autotransporter domain-containing protein n=1 Tax=Pseudomonas brassicacearum TaxID=930166 RepID=A0A423HA79_9PSED|nr:autotransporter outer membrane beta-barrel domain-containing protein [Pseudomonas brassicacearum]RON10090.1 hypothetical protein BK659_09310 [Pseudomonas brassicacearum]
MLKPRFNVKPLVIALGASSLAMLSLTATDASARDLVDESLTIDSSADVESWSLARNAVLTVNGGQALGITAQQSTLNVNGGSTQQISAQSGSTVNLDKATVNGIDRRKAGVELINSTATITNSTLSGITNGLQVGHVEGTLTGSTATVAGSRISGQDLGARVTAFSTLTLSNSMVEGTGATSTGLLLFSSKASASNGTRIIGGQNGVMVKVEVPGEGSQLVLDNSSVEGKTGSAIVVDNAGATNTITDIHVLNGSTLKGGNGTLLEVKGAASVNMNVGGSALNGNAQVAGNSTANLNFNQGSLTGDVIAEAGSTANVQLKQGSLLTGRMENVAAVGIDHQSEWNLTGNSQVGNLNMMDGGTVRFGAADAYYQLDVTNLSGNGLFIMGTHFTTGQTDALNVTGTASGNHQLLITSSGVDPASGEPITVVHTQGGDARFSLANADGAVDLGTYSYGLSQDATGKDWFLDPAKRTVSPSTQVVSALFGAPLTVLYGEDASLRTRMGEVRFNTDKSGAWSRVYGNKYNVGGAFGDGYRQTQQGFALGVDTPLGDGQWLLGVMAGYSQSDLSLSHGSSGTVDSYYLGSYLTWMDDASGYYVDGTLKLNRFENKAKVAMSDGTQSKGDYGNTGVSGSVEFGRNIKLDDGYFIEPFTRWSTAFIQGQDYDLDNGMQAKGDRTWSFVGKAGLTAGREMPMANGGTLQPYVRAALAHEFSKGEEFKVNDNAFSHDLSGSRVEVGAGVALKLTDRWSAHAEVEYMNGNNIEMPIGGTVGVQFKW